MAYFVPGGGIVACQTPGVDQTNVLSFNQQGQLCASWVVSGGPWQGPLTIGQVPATLSGGNLAASPQIGASQTDFFFIDNLGQLTVVSVGANGQWGNPTTIGPAGLGEPGGFVAVSQQFGANQTDVFLIDTNGQLNVFWAAGQIGWYGPLKLGPIGIASPGTPLAVSQQFGANQTDVFLIDSSGQLNVFWVADRGAWNGPLKLGPLGLGYPCGFVAASQQFGANQTNVFTVDREGQLNVFWVGGEGAWSGPETISPAGLAMPGGCLAVSQQIGATQTDVFLVDGKGQLNVFWVGAGGAWSGPEAIGAAGAAPPGCPIVASQQFGLDQTDVFLIDNNGMINIFWVGAGGAWSGPQVRGDPVAAPTAGLQGNSNYILCNGCNALTSLTITIRITEDIVFQSAAQPDPANTATLIPGFGFQLNAYSPQGAESVIQQYCLAVNNAALRAIVQCWNVSPAGTPTSLLLSDLGVTDMPHNTLPAGWTLKMTLLFTGASSVVDGVIFAVTDNLGEPRGEGPLVPLESVAGATAADLAPIVAFQLNFVGPINGESALLSSGAGTIVYESSDALTVENAVPSCAGLPVSPITVEEANTTYAPLSTGASTMFTQAFSVNTDQTQMAIHRQRGILALPLLSARAQGAR